MKRHYEDLDQALHHLDQDVIWSSNRFERNKNELSSKLLLQRSAQQVSRRKQPRKRFVPVMVTLVFFGIFAAFIFNIISGNNQMVVDDPDGREQTNADGDDQTKKTDEDTNDEEDVTDPKENTNDEEPQQPLEEMFEKEKEIEIELEGMKEMIPVELATNDEWRYVIYVEKDRYIFKRGETADRIELKEPLEDLPEVAMEIRRLGDGIGVSEAIEQVKQEINNDDLEIERNEDVTKPLEATAITALGEERTEHGKFGHQWDTPVHQYYVIASESGHVFVIKQMFFLEAAEGHGARFDQLLETFQVVPIE